MTLKEFTEEQKKQLEKFEQEFKTNYPSLDNLSEGEWIEQYLAFLDID